MELDKLMSENQKSIANALYSRRREVFNTLFNPLSHRDAFSNRADPDQAALLRAALPGSTLFAYGNMIRYDPTLVDLTSNFIVLGTNMKVYLVGGA